MKTPTILDVNPDLSNSQWEDDFMTRMELHVLLCSGPPEKGTCPILKYDTCPIAEKADGILFQLDLDRPMSRAILRRYIDHMDIPIRVVATEEQAARYADLLADVEVMHPPVGPSGLDGFAAEVEHQ